MPRLLVITYYWPPSGGSGVQRWLKFAKYLPAQGWTPVIVAPLAADYPVVDESLEADVDPALEVLRYPITEPYAAYRKLTGAQSGDVKAAPTGSDPGLLKRLANWVRANLFVPDPRVWWVKPTSKSLAGYLREHPVDAILTTGPPHSVHLIGLSLKHAFPSLPWVMDIRDPWSQFDVHLAFNPGNRARVKNQRLEKQCLSGADLVIGTSPSMPTHLESFNRSKYRSVTNGYDAEDFAEEVELVDGRFGKREPFTIYHTGLLSANRNPTSVWQALAELCTADARFAERLHLRLIGNVDPSVTADIERYPTLRDKLTVTAWLPHGELLAHYRAADLFLLCPNLSDNARGQINGKLFEYLAARRPILHVGPFDADNTRILDQAHAGLTVLPGDVDAARDAIERIYSGRFSDSEHAFAKTVIEGFERRATTARLAELLNELIDTPAPRA